MMMMMTRRMRIEPFLCMMMMMDEGVVSLLGEFLSLKRLKLLIKISSKQKRLVRVVKINQYTRDDDDDDNACCVCIYIVIHLHSREIDR